VCVVLTFTESRKYDDYEIVSYFKVVTGGTLGHIKGKCVVSVSMCDVCVCVCVCVCVLIFILQIDFYHILFNISLLTFIYRYHFTLPS
jgi:hypothetical protein